MRVFVIISLLLTSMFSLAQDAHWGEYWGASKFGLKLFPSGSYVFMDKRTGIEQDVEIGTFDVVNDTLLLTDSMQNQSVYVLIDSFTIVPIVMQQIRIDLILYAKRRDNEKGKWIVKSRFDRYGTRVGSWLYKEDDEIRIVEYPIE